jgi:hypothetical protein
MDFSAYSTDVEPGLSIGTWCTDENEAAAGISEE